VSWSESGGVLGYEGSFGDAVLDVGGRSLGVLKE
jgi:hypothetical protein